MTEDGKINLSLLFMIIMTKLPVADTIQRQMIRLLVNAELESIWKETFK
jgi:hypothetical protein